MADFLVIRFEKEDSVPEVIFEGKELEHKVHIACEWETDTDVVKPLQYRIVTASIQDDRLVMTTNTHEGNNVADGD